MKLLKSFLILLLLSNFVMAEDFGIYEKVAEKVQGNAEEVANLIAQKVQESNFLYLNALKISTPNLIRKNEEKHTPFQAFLVLATDTTFDRFLATLGNRYAANWILRIGIYENENGTHVVIANPVTLTRIICNDLNDSDYENAIVKSEMTKRKLRQVILSAVQGTERNEQLPPIRSDQRLRKAKKDMLMMVGPMTFFKDKDQFPILMEFNAGADAQTKFAHVLEMVKKNIAAFDPDEDDSGYHWTKKPETDLKWRIVGEAKLSGINAAVLGITRNRTEALSFHICGMKRESNENSTPGIDHVCAYPIEVVVFEENGKIKVGTPREMFRMDMFFWDAGKWAFMKYMNMPKMLDKSIKKAVIGKQ